MKPVTLKWRIVILVGIVQFFVFLFFAGYTYSEMREQMYDTLDHSLLDMSERMIDYCKHHTEPFPESEQILRELGLHNSRQFNLTRAWWNDTSSLITHSGMDESELQPFLSTLDEHTTSPTTGIAFYDIILSNGWRYRCSYVSIAIAGRVLHVAIGLPSRDVMHELRDYIRLISWTGLSLMLILTVITMLIVLHGFKPLETAVRDIHELSMNNLKEAKLNTSKSPQELQAVMDALSNLMARLNTSMDRQHQFTADASHELRTPLTLLKTTLQSALRRASTLDEFRESIQGALQVIERMQRLIQQLLTLAQTEATQCDDQFADVHINLLLQDLVHSFCEEADSTNCRIRFEAVAEIHVRGNFDMLLQMFFNVVDNALKYGPEQGIVRVIAKALSGQCEICIVDQGGEISQESLSRLGERFYRVDPSRNRKTGGTGLGLHIARTIAQVHNGTFLIESQHVSGTVVRITLPTLPRHS